MLSYRNCKRSWLLTTHALLKESHNCAELQIEARKAKGESHSRTGCKFSLLIAPGNKEYGNPILAANNLATGNKKRWDNDLVI
jgi:hypothetical protein